jgi:hypothetical protein
MNGETPRGRRAVAFLGESKAVYKSEVETDETIDDAHTREKGKVLCRQSSWMS